MQPIIRREELEQFKREYATLHNLAQEWSAPLGVDTDQAAVLPVCRMC